MEQIVHYKESSQSSHPYQLQQTKFYNRISPIFEIRKKQKRTKFVSRDLFAALFSAKCLASKTSAKVSEIYAFTKCFGMRPFVEGIVDGRQRRVCGYTYAD